MAQQVQLSATVAESQLGQRLDQALAELFPDYSRSRIKEWILEDRVTVDGKTINKPKEKVLGGELVAIDAQIEEDARWAPQDIPLDIVYEDNDILVINKPRGLVVHPGAGNPDGTILNALLYYYPEIMDVPRAGIVHRLDKDTTGLMVVAKTVPAQTRLVEALQAREITREYEAVAIGNMTAGGRVDEPISRHSTKRTHMAVHPMGKPATTHYRIMEHFRAHTRLRLRLETGRTHQIRVHMSHINHPLVGDQLYGGRPRPPRGASDSFISILRGFDRQALHATMLRLYHPISGIQMEWHAALPEDMVELINALKADTEEFKDQMDW
ncbi:MULTISPECIES: 23S rRNA pseudouridine(1911/1915/1917) synthase RluD [Yersinia]|jgi:23S rRNA pseudouridine1911/1915/1917 synthase|uniref:Pseudouridine synthase n=1 Tax=Yersinia intermedia TaxID=631 RepID=A0A0T9LMA3_YERIN|nr:MULTISPECIES: 23S rRNA pseudouridine(1911/1915/1917) synthase RluD [Yersinia]AJJ19583.1 ribosomal large subunit pseudouridine synthase D [Yersinia intermedia]ARB84031.1 23S rRNA pseudouridine(1911/1915/1917) synthase RluD [Yersinia sp. FDAARGOS_228]AVL37826.1 23S rRNA pseudouridine(1911/1915/1917) synthase RluD [Yersinia intermedia]EEQ21043.1 Ribosomal large subunit pseudouridine synthase D [Yersinia intermedia ATCC 29909]MCB5298762.1 23S rRNA pseudouridine(1911/1915/1917) synthase RluD [Ye